MGNNCVGSTKDGLFHSVSNSLWWSRSTGFVSHGSRGINSTDATPQLSQKNSEAPLYVQNNAPEQVKIEKEDYKPVQPSNQKEKVQPDKPKEPAQPQKQKEETILARQVTLQKGETKPAQPKIHKEPGQPIPQKAETKPAVAARPKKPHSVKRVASAGLQADSVLQTKTGHLKEFFNLGQKLGHGQFGTTFLCVEKSTGKEYACKSIAKRKLLTTEDVEDVRREIQIMHHLAGNQNVIAIKAAYEDAVAVHVVMELCSGGELFDRIIKRGHFTERKAAQLTRTIVGVIEACHSLGVMHRDLKPENFLFVNEDEDSSLKAIDFGLSIFFKPGMS